MHLRLGACPSHEEELYGLRDALFDEPGPCSVYFHLPLQSGAAVAGAAEAVIKAHVQITCSASEGALERLRAVSPVSEAWRD